MEYGIQYYTADPLNDGVAPDCLQMGIDGSIEALVVTEPHIFWETSIVLDLGVGRGPNGGDELDGF